MKIAAYQFAVTGEISVNLEKMNKAIEQAAKEGVNLLAFPECALTGYPPHDIACSAELNFAELEKAYDVLQKAADDNGMYLIVGTILRKEDIYYNSAIVFSPNRARQYYHKRALWGWDKDNFAVGNEDGIFDIDGLKVGIRICYEVRFPEFFRELYKKSTDLNVILFYDAADYDHKERYDVIKGHIVTRAVENVTHTLSVNTTYPYQTAPTALYDKSGYVLSELERNQEGLLVYDLEIEQANFGEQGRIEISDLLMGK